MIFVKKKTIQIFSDGSLNVSSTFLKKSNKIKVSNKDHTTFTFNKKNANLLLNSKDFGSFKTKYFKF